MIRRCYHILAVLGLAIVLAGTQATARRGVEGPPGAPGVPGAKVLTGMMLVATPEMMDPRFRETVVFMVNHNRDGAMGLVVNRVLGKMELYKLLRGFGVERKGIKGTVRVHYGGPVEPKVGFILHSADFVRDESVLVTRDVAMTRDIKALVDITGDKGSRRSFVAMGYSGWGGGQLEREIKRRDWYVIPADTDIIFDDRIETKWKRAMAKHGVEL